MVKCNRECITEGCDGVAYIHSLYCFKCLKKQKEKGKIKGYNKIKKGIKKLKKIY